MSSPDTWVRAGVLLRRRPRRAVEIGLEVLRARYFLRRCSTLGTGVRLIGRPLVVNHGVITIGAKTRIASTTVRCEFGAFRGGRLEIGRDVFINYGVSMAATRLIRIGDGCDLGTYVILMDNDYHGVEDRDRPAPSEPVILEDNVWLGARVIVLKGVTIGRDSVIGAGSVVTRDIPPRCLAAGAPARVIRSL